ncbi:unnamed protein product [Lampetra fluviatilis]
MDNGRLLVTSYEVGGVASYACRPGFRMVGASNRVCEASGRWSGSVPVCRARPTTGCPEPGLPLGGLGPLPGLSLRFRAGDVLRFSCLPGFAITGATSLRCLDSGRWSDEAPTCSRVGMSLSPLWASALIAAGCVAGGAAVLLVSFALARRGEPWRESLAMGGATRVLGVLLAIIACQVRATNTTEHSWSEFEDVDDEKRALAPATDDEVQPRTPRGNPWDAAKRLGGSSSSSSSTTTTSSSSPPRRPSSRKPPVAPLLSTWWFRYGRRDASRRRGDAGDDEVSTAAQSSGAQPRRPFPRHLWWFRAGKRSATQMMPVSGAHAE